MHFDIIGGMALQRHPGKMISDFAVLELTDRIYEAALDPAQWSAALIQLSDLMQAPVPVFMMQGRGKDEIAGFFPRTDPTDLIAYRDYWAQRNPLYEKTITHPPFKIVTLDNTVGRSTFKASPFYNEWSKPQGIGKVLGMQLSREGGIPSVLSVFRPLSADDFTSEQIRLFSLVARHVARAAEIYRLVSLADLWQGVMLTTLEADGKAAILVDDRCRVLCATPLSQRQFEADGVLCLSDSCLSIIGKPGSLEALIASCLATDAKAIPGGKCIVQSKNGHPVELTVAPFRAPEPATAQPWFAASRPMAMVIVVEPEIERQQTAAHWRASYGLTPAETRLAIEIMRGGGRRAAANRLGISDATARAHLSNIFAKTGTSRQAELVAVLSGVTNGTGRKHHNNGA